MEQERKDRLVAGGIDVDAALGNFMNNEKMLEKYLNKFLTEKSYAKLLESIEAKDNTNATMAAHTLKSVTGTLGCRDMNGMMVQQEALFKNGQWDEAVAMMPQITAAYEQICALLRE